MQIVNNELLLSIPFIRWSPSAPNPKTQSTPNSNPHLNFRQYLPHPTPVVDSQTTMTLEPVTTNDEAVSLNDDSQTTMSSETVTPNDDSQTTMSSETVTPKDEAVTPNDKAVTPNNEAVTPNGETVTSNDEEEIKAQQRRRRRLEKWKRKCRKARLRQVKSWCREEQFLEGLRLVMPNLPPLRAVGFSNSVLVTAIPPGYEGDLPAPVAAPMKQQSLQLESSNADQLSRLARELHYLSVLRVAAEPTAEEQSEEQEDEALGASECPADPENNTEGLEEDPKVSSTGPAAEQGDGAMGESESSVDPEDMSLGLEEDSKVSNTGFSAEQEDGALGASDYPVDPEDNTVGLAEDPKVSFTESATGQEACVFGASESSVDAKDKSLALKEDPKVSSTGSKRKRRKKRRRSSEDDYVEDDARLSQKKKHPRRGAKRSVDSPVMNGPERQDYMDSVPLLHPETNMMDDEQKLEVAASTLSPVAETFSEMESEPQSDIPSRSDASGSENKSGRKRRRSRDGDEEDMSAHIQKGQRKKRRRRRAAHRPEYPSVNRHAESLVVAASELSVASEDEKDRNVEVAACTSLPVIEILEVILRSMT